MCDHYFRHFGKRYPPYLIIDNASQKWGTNKNGLTIYSPDILCNYKSNEIHLIICNIYVVDIASQIKKIGDFEFYIYWEKYIERVLDYKE